MTPLAARRSMTPSGGDSQLIPTGLPARARTRSNMSANAGASAPKPEAKHRYWSAPGASAMISSARGRCSRFFGSVIEPGVRSTGFIDEASGVRIGASRSRVRASSGGTTSPSRAHWSVAITPLPPPKLLITTRWPAGSRPAGARRAAGRPPAAPRERTREWPRTPGRSRRTSDRCRRAGRCERAPRGRSPRWRRPSARRPASVGAALRPARRRGPEGPTWPRLDGDHAGAVVVQQRAHEIGDAQRGLVAAADREPEAEAEPLGARVGVHRDAAALADHRDAPGREPVELRHQGAERRGQSDRRVDDADAVRAAELDRAAAAQLGEPLLAHAAGLVALGEPAGPHDGRRHRGLDALLDDAEDGLGGPSAPSSLSAISWSSWRAYAT